MLKSSSTYNVAAKTELKSPEKKDAQAWCSTNHEADSSGKYFKGNLDDGLGGIRPRVSQGKKKDENKVRDKKKYRNKER